MLSHFYGHCISQFISQHPLFWFMTMGWILVHGYLLWLVFETLLSAVLHSAHVLDYDVIKQAHSQSQTPVSYTAIYLYNGCHPYTAISHRLLCRICRDRYGIVWGQKYEGIGCGYLCCVKQYISK